MSQLAQLSDDDSGRQLQWLPTQLPPYVRVVVSTLPDGAAGHQKYGCLPALQQRLHPESFVEVKLLQTFEVSLQEKQQQLDGTIEAMGRLVEVLEDLQESDRRAFHSRFDRFAAPKNEQRFLRLFKPAKTAKA